MTTQQIIILIAILAAVIVFVASRRSGPRITRIDRTVRREKEGEE